MLIEECKGSARDEAAMRDKWITQALKVHRINLEKAEEKSNVVISKRAALKAQEEIDGKKIECYKDENNDGDSDDDNDSNDDNKDGEENDNRDSVKKEKYFSGGFSIEQCMVAVRLKAKEREEAANNRQPEIVRDGQDGTCYLMLHALL